MCFALRAVVCNLLFFGFPSVFPGFRQPHLFPISRGQSVNSKCRVSFFSFFFFDWFARKIFGTAAVLELELLATNSALLSRVFRRKLVSLWWVAGSVGFTRVAAWCSYFRVTARKISVPAVKTGTCYYNDTVNIDISSIFSHGEILIRHCES